MSKISVNYPALHALVDQLPLPEALMFGRERSAAWTSKRREDFMEVFGRLLDYSIEVRDGTASAVTAPGGIVGPVDVDAPHFRAGGVA